MMGNLAAPPAFVEAAPGIQSLPGPHGITLRKNAELGGETAHGVLAYLDEGGGADVLPTNLPLPIEREGYLGRYTFGPGVEGRFEITVGRMDALMIQRGEPRPTAGCRLRRMFDLRQPLAFLIAVALAVACAGSEPGSEPPAGTRPLPPRPTTLTLMPPVHHLDGLAREPMLVEHPSGILFLAGYGSQVTGVDPRSVPKLWRSADHGVTWSRVDVGTVADGAIGNSDVDLAVGPDGTLYFAAMGFDRSTREGTHIAIGASPDAGRSWSWSLVAERRFDDRPWVRVTPDGTAHAIWNDGSGVAYATSSDHGRSWIERPRIHPVGGSSHFAAGPNGELAVRIAPIAASGNVFDEGVELIAVSLDGGESWVKHPAPGERGWDPTFTDPSQIPRWVEPLAWDARGALFYLWSAGSEVRLARSSDRGESWREWPVASFDRPAFFPYMVARGTGELAATWFVGAGDEMAAQAVVILVPDDDTEAPTTVRARSFQPEVWQERDDVRRRDPGGEYLPIVFLGDGALGVAAPIQDSSGDRFGFSYWRLELE